MASDVGVELGLLGDAVEPSIRMVVSELPDARLVYVGSELLDVAVDPSPTPMVWELSDGTIVYSKPKLVGKVVGSSITSVVWELTEDSNMSAVLRLLGVAAVVDPSSRMVVWVFSVGVDVCAELRLSGLVVDASVWTVCLESSTVKVEYELLGRVADPSGRTVPGDLSGVTVVSSE